MNTNIALAAAILLSFAVPAFAQDAPRTQEQLAASSNRSEIDQIIAQWPERPRLGAQQMIAKYGPPQEATPERLIWNRIGQFKRITVTKMEHHHDFPLPHTDYIEHTIDYRVPAGKADELTKYDGSCTFDKTQGELSARCDLEGHNILTLNLAYDILTGKKSAEEARKAFGENVADDLAGKYPPYTVALQFEPKTPAEDADKPTIPGAPKRAMKEASEVKTTGKDDTKPEAREEKMQTAVAKSGSDAEILSLILAVDTNEIVAALEAGKKKLAQPIADYAKMLHTEHGKNVADTIKVGIKIDVTPIDTEKTNTLRKKGAGELAMIAPLEGEEFGAKYVEAMVKGHGEVLALIDDELLPSAQNDAVKKHLSETREHVAMHLEKGRALQAGMEK
jgi:predicted outer membrane protein